MKELMITISDLLPTIVNIGLTYFIIVGIISIIIFFIIFFVIFGSFGRINKKNRF